MDTILGPPSTLIFAAYGAFILGLVSPGPDFLLVTALAVGRGRRAAFVAAVGISVGVAFWALLAAVGMGAAIQGTPAIWEGIRLLGGGILIYLGARAVSSALREDKARATIRPGKRSAGSFLLGLLTNLSNPKAAIVLIGLTAVLAQSYPDRGDLMIVVAGMPALTLIWFSFLAATLAMPGAQGRLLKHRRVLSFAMGAALVLAGLSLIQSMTMV